MKRRLRLSLTDKTPQTPLHPPPLIARACSCRPRIKISAVWISGLSGVRRPGTEQPNGLDNPHFNLTRSSFSTPSTILPRQPLSKLLAARSWIDVGWTPYQYKLYADGFSTKAQVSLAELPEYQQYGFQGRSSTCMIQRAPRTMDSTNVRFEDMIW